MVLSIVERIKGFLFSPSLTFDASKEDTFSDAFKYFLLLLIIYSVIFGSIMMLLASSAMSRIVRPIVTMLGLVAEPILAVAMIISLLILGIISIFIFGLWLHLWVYLVGGRRGMIQTIKAVMYGETPHFLVGWIPFVGIIGGIWTLIVKIIGIRQLQELSTGKAVLAVILALLILMLVLPILFTGRI